MSEASPPRRVRYQAAPRSDTLVGMAQTARVCNGIYLPILRFNRLGGARGSQGIKAALQICHFDKYAVQALSRA